MDVGTVPAVQWHLCCSLDVLMKRDFFFSSEAFFTTLELAFHMASRPGELSTCLRDSWDLAGAIPASSVRGTLPAGINVDLDASSLPG